MTSIVESVNQNKLENIIIIAECSAYCYECANKHF